MDNAIELQIRSQKERAIPPLAVKILYDSCGWWPERTLDDIAAVVGEGPACGAWKAEALVGFVRAVSDKSFRAYIEDVVVDPAHRGSGIATQLLRSIQQELKDVDVVSLFCSAEHKSLYERSGFKSTDRVVMHYSRS